MKSLKHPSFVFFVALVALALSFFALNPWLTRLEGAPTATFVYLGVRIAVIVAYGFVLARFYRRPRNQVFRAATFLIFLDQVGFKLLWVSQDMKAHPANWEGIGLGSAFMGLAMSYILFVPIVILLSYLGMELSTLGKGRISLSV